VLSHKFQLRPSNSRLQQRPNPFSPKLKTENLQRKTFSLVQRGAATTACAHLGAIRQRLVADARGLVAAAADDLHIGRLYRSFLLHDSALDVLGRVGTRVALDDVGVLHNQRVFPRIDGKDAAALAGIAAAQHADVIALANADGETLDPVSCACHRLPDLRSQRYDLGELLLAQLSCHGTKYARPHRLAGIVDEHRGVVIEADVRAVLAAVFLAHAHDDALHNLAFLDLAFRRRFLHRRGDDVTQPGLQSRVATEGENAHELPRSGIVGHRQPGSHHYHVCAPVPLLRRRLAGQHFLQTPALEARERPGGHDGYGVALLGFALFIVRVELLRDAHHAAILGVLHQPLHLDHDRFFHLRAGYLADEFGPLAALGHRCALRFRCHYALPAFAGFAPAVNSWWRRRVFTRARSFLASRSRLSASAWPVPNWNLSRKICSARSFSRACNSVTPSSRIFSMRRAIARFLLCGRRISSEWAACAPPAPALGAPSLRQFPPFQT